MAEEKQAEASMKEIHIAEGIQKAIELVEALGRASKGLPLTPGFIAHKLRMLKRGEA
jgi:hypothetical protein